MPKILHCKEEDFEELMIFMEKSYGASHGFFPRHYPNVWRPDNIQYENRLIIKEKGKIVSHVGIFPLIAVVKDVEVRIGGIGAVATLPEFRGKGYMSRLMDYAIQRMKEAGFPISILWGDRQRYANFGYEVAGKVMVFELTRRSLGKASELSPINVARLDERPELLKEVISVHEDDPLRIKREEEDYALIFNKPSLITLLGEREGKFAYLSFYNHVVPPKSLVECGGDHEVLLPLIYAFLKNWNVESVQIPFPYFAARTFFSLLEASSQWRIQPLGMIKILNLSQIIKSYSRIIEKRVQELGLKGGLTLEIKERKEKVTLCVGPRLTFREKDSEEKISLSEREMVRLLFGSPYLVDIKRPSPLLYGLFPLPLYVGTLDHI